MFSRTPLQIALCSATHAHELVALNFELPADGSVPEWVELIPAGDQVVGIDGRRWVNDQPEAVLQHNATLRAHNRDLVLDWEHSTELKAPQGEPAPAAAWFPQLEVREGAVWGRAEWTERGRNSVASREYRYLSPVLIYEKDTRRIVGLSSVGLTNRPNLRLTALNREAEPGFTNPKEPDMEFLKALRAALKLKEDATEQEVLSALNHQQQELSTAMNRAENPSLEKFVPRADYDKALERATNAEKQVADIAAETLTSKIDTAINQALEAGKITPATVDYHKAACREEGGLERFEKYVEAAPAVAGDTGLDGKKPDGDKEKALNAEQARIAAAFGNTAEDLAKYGADA